MSLADAATELCQQAHDEGGLALVLMMDKGGQWKFACPHLSTSRMEYVLLAAIEAYRDAMRPRAVN